MLTGLVAATGFVNPAEAAADYHCYGTGHWLDRVSLAYHAGRACNGYDGVKGAFQGWFAPNEHRSVCVNSWTGKIIMEIHNQNKAKGFDLADADCGYEFSQILNKCPPTALITGGYGTNSGWYFR